MNKHYNSTHGPELTYDEAAEIIGVSPRAVRDVLKKYRTLCPALRYSYRNVRFHFVAVLAVKRARRAAILRKAVAL